MRIFTTAIVATFLATTAAFAAVPALTDEIKAQIVSVLAEQGHTVGKIKIEDGLYEAYAKKDGSKFEVFLNEAYEVVRIKED